MTPRAPQTNLTAEQAAAICTDTPGVFIEAYPGSGKTTVASERFGVIRFSKSAATDPRAIVATSFTKAATRELRLRILRCWGPAALAWPHRVVTVDTLLRDVLVWLLKQRHISWVGGAIDLEVHDSWRGAVETASTRLEPHARFIDGTVTVTQRVAARHKNRPSMATFSEAMRAGVCTHDEVRAVTLGALLDSTTASNIAQRLKETVRALIIDEAFDANDLDVAFLRACLGAGIATTIIGDPWQALYEFRGARPAKVRALTTRPDVVAFPLTASFRWRSDEQRLLTDAIRRSAGVTLAGVEGRTPDVVLAGTWKALWEADARILPLALGAAKHDLAYAGATLVLSQITLARFDTPGPFLRDARTTLGLGDPEMTDRAERWATGMALQLAGDGSLTPREAYDDMAEQLGAIIGRQFRRAHYSRYIYFRWLAARARSSDPLVLGMTIHQAKGQEWDHVSLVLSDPQADALRRGLRESEASDRALYVGCTRARVATTAWSS